MIGFNYCKKLRKTVQESKPECKKWCKGKRCKYFIEGLEGEGALRK